MPASSGASCATSPSTGCDATPTTPRAANCGYDATSDTSSTGATQVSAPASASTHSSRVRVANAATNAARIPACAASSYCDAASYEQPSAAHRLAKNLASMAPTASHFPSDPAYVP